MQVRHVMTQGASVTSPDSDLQQAGQMMAQLDAGILPVGENDRLIGMITDRDIVIRAVAEGRNPQNTLVREIMSTDVKYCFQDEELEDVAENMAQLQVRRLPVLSREKRLVGIISLGDISLESTPSTSGEALRGVSVPSGQRSQSMNNRMEPYRRTRRQRMRPAASKSNPVLIATMTAGLAAAAMYYFDRSEGELRRLTLRARLANLTSGFRDSSAEAGRSLRERLRGSTDRSRSSRSIDRNTPILESSAPFEASSSRASVVTGNGSEQQEGASGRA
jgi:CBS domain-containing protein